MTDHLERLVKKDDLVLFFRRNLRTDNHFTAFRHFDVAFCQPRTDHKVGFRLKRNHLHLCRAAAGSQRLHIQLRRAGLHSLQ